MISRKQRRTRIPDATSSWYWRRCSWETCLHISVVETAAGHIGELGLPGHIGTRTSMTNRRTGPLGHKGELGLPGHIG